MFAQESVMEIKKLKAEFEKLKYVEEKLEYLNFDEHLDCYVEKNNGMPVGLAAWVNGAFYGFEQAAKVQAVQGWISVEDGLPAKFGMRVRIKRNWWDEDDNDVVVESEATFDKDSDFCELSHKTYEYETWFDHQLNKYLDEGYVMYWMPLPDAPQEPAND